MYKRQEECFAPNEPITREQMAAIIYRYAAFKGYDITTSSNTSYTDNDDISDYAKDAVIWAAEKSVMTGNTCLLYTSNKAIWICGSDCFLPYSVSAEIPFQKNN